MLYCLNPDLHIVLKREVGERRGRSVGVTIARITSQTNPRDYIIHLFSQSLFVATCILYHRGFSRTLPSGWGSRCVTMKILRTSYVGPG